MPARCVPRLLLLCSGSPLPPSPPAEKATAREDDPRGILLSVCARELPMKAFLLLVTWLASNQPPSHYQVQFSSNETCEAARQQLIKDAERIRQAMIERATAQDRQIGGGNKTSLLMTAIANATYVSAVCVAE